ncbi:MAG: rhomboid family intramembrane serine protease [Deltaproteobacteria bacterium]|nr:rhomboid family intramembrane serine protease [Deltaproteobacteria bacterium]MBI3293790.1 rhomboid family intramembrane serine protease [Deltaproteobacteria bacterium]
MILVVPITPEVPKRLRPKPWYGLVLAGLLIFGYWETTHTIRQDLDYVANLELPPDVATSTQSLPKIDDYLKLRPLLTIAPARGDWSLSRLLMANFIHGSHWHLILNVLCAFAGARICATFLPLATLIAIFTAGGSIGLFASMFLSNPELRYIPHIGGSAGIFALMGAYYVYNFRFRTRYFFWFPTRDRYFLSLPTGTFFFVDVILVELVLSAAQVLPGRWDNVDHFAHVFGFMSGVAIAVFFRTAQGWPAAIHTRAEYFLHRFLVKKREGELTFADFLTLLDLNSFNDPLKCVLIDRMQGNSLNPSGEEIAAFFRFISPTFMRYQTKETAILIRTVVIRGKTFPRKWLHKLPYDLLIQIAYEMSATQQSRYALLRLFYTYIAENAERPNVVSRVQNLTEQLENELEMTHKRASSYDV